MSRNWARWTLCVCTVAGTAAWTPQKKKVPGRTWLEAISDELDSSLSMFPPLHGTEEVEAFLARLLFEPLYTVMILQNRLIVDRRILLTRKGLHHIEFVKSVLELGPVPNLIYQFESNADGIRSEDQLVREGCPDPKWMSSERVKPQSRSKQKKNVPIPKLVIAKRYGYDQCGILIPNCYFDDVSKWGKIASQITSVTANIPFDQRLPRVFWRGSVRTQDFCLDEVGNFARLQALSLTATQPDVFDVKCLECNPRDEARMPCPQLPYDSDMKWTAANINKVAGHHVNKTTFASYKYQLNLPGSVSGSYSRNLNHLWMIGSVVVLWDAPYVEWYYPALEDGVTHVTINKTNANSIIRSLDDTKTAHLLANSQRVYENILCTDCLSRYFRRVVHRMRQYFHLDLILDDPVALKRLLARVDIPNLQLVEFSFNAYEERIRYSFITSSERLLAIADGPATYYRQDAVYGTSARRRT